MTNKNGTPVEVYKGHQINRLGAGYNCPTLGLYGYATDTALKRAINKKLKPYCVRCKAAHDPVECLKYALRNGETIGEGE